MADVAAALKRCWRPPRGLAGFERLEQTVRFSLRRDGTLIGGPRVTFVDAAGPGPVRELLVRAATDAVRRCTPMELDPGLAGQVAGRPLSVRLIYEGPKGRGA